MKVKMTVGQLNIVVTPSEENELGIPSMSLELKDHSYEAEYEGSEMGQLLEAVNLAVKNINP